MAIGNHGPSSLKGWRDGLYNSSSLDGRLGGSKRGPEWPKFRVRRGGPEGGLEGSNLRVPGGSGGGSERPKILKILVPEGPKKSIFLSAFGQRDDYKNAWNHSVYSGHLEWKLLSSSKCGNGHQSLLSSRTLAGSSREGRCHFYTQDKLHVGRTTRIFRHHHSDYNTHHDYNIHLDIKVL